MKNHEDWGVGPWNDEPDHDVWVDEHTDLDCMINRGPSGALCGYVGVGPDHPWHGLTYNDVIDGKHIDEHLDVHGGLTYSQACQEGGEICHVPEPGREHDIWWFGFDCAHAFDVTPKMDADLRELRTRIPNFPELTLDSIDPRMRSTYKDWAYVICEIESLAQQLRAVAK